MNFVSGTALAVLLSVAAAPAVIAEPMTGEQLSQTQIARQDARPDWEVQSINNGRITVKMQEGGAMQTFMIMPEAVQELDLKTGSIIELNYDNVMVGTVASATQTNIDVDIEGKERMTYVIPESGNDYDLGDTVVVTPTRILSRVSDWQLSAADVTVIQPVETVSSVQTTTAPATPSTSVVVETETSSEAEVETEVEAVPGLW